MCLELSAWCSTTKKLSQEGKAETHSESEFKFSCTRSQDTESRNPHLKNKIQIRKQKQKHASVMCLGTLAAPHLFTIQNWEQKVELLLAGTGWQIVRKKHVMCAESAGGPAQRLILQLDALVNGLDGRPRCKISACRCSAGAPGPGQCLGWSDRWDQISSCAKTTPGAVPQSLSISDSSSCSLFCSCLWDAIWCFKVGAQNSTRSFASQTFVMSRKALTTPSDWWPLQSDDHSVL